MAGQRQRTKKRERKGKKVWRKYVTTTRLTGQIRKELLRVEKWLRKSATIVDRGGVDRPTREREYVCKATHDEIRKIGFKCTVCWDRKRVESNAAVDIERASQRSSYRIKFRCVIVPTPCGIYVTKQSTGLTTLLRSRVVEKAGTATCTHGHRAEPAKPPHTSRFLLPKPSEM